jgi:cyanobactin maturation PatA/PatG family protease
MYQNFLSDLRFLGYGDPDICIAVIDGPVDLSHECFDGARLRSVKSIASTRPRSGFATAHGTHVASVIFGREGSVIQGIAPRCSGLIIPVFSDEYPNENLSCTQLDLARAILLAVEKGAHIINISGGQLSDSGEPEPILAATLDVCNRKNVLVIAAAGNDGCRCIHVPASRATLAVGAMDENGSPISSSNWGNLYADNGILAPGVEILGALPKAGVTRRTGTSFSTPVITGLCALLLSFQLRNKQRVLSPINIKKYLLETADPCSSPSEKCEKFLGGRVNLLRCIKQFKENFGEEMDDKMRDEATVSGSINRGKSDSDPSCDLKIPGFKIESIPSTAQIVPSDCGCNNKNGNVQADDNALIMKSNPIPDSIKVYALGKLGFDFGSDAKRDGLAQAMDEDHNNPLDPTDLLNFLRTDPYEGTSLIWTLNLDATPIYAIQPMGPFSEDAYKRLYEFLQGQVEEGVELISVPGTIVGNIRLQSGQIIPVVKPIIRGMYSWSPSDLVSEVLGQQPVDENERFDYERKSSGLTDFLNRVYYDIRNLGITAEERAINFAATNALQVSEVIRSTTEMELDLDTFTVKKSPVCRPDSDCYDVELSFFNPANTNIANRIYRFTIDVSDVMPVSIGATRSWTKRAPR